MERVANWLMWTWIIQSMDGHISVCVCVCVCVRARSQSLSPALAGRRESDPILAGVRSGEKGGGLQLLTHPHTHLDNHPWQKTIWWAGPLRISPKYVKSPAHFCLNPIMVHTLPEEEPLGSKHCKDEKSGRLNNVPLLALFMIISSFIFNHIPRDMWT